MTPYPEEPSSEGDPTGSDPTTGGEPSAGAAPGYTQGVPPLSESREELLGTWRGSGSCRKLPGSFLGRGAGGRAAWVGLGQGVRRWVEGILKPGGQCVCVCVC